MYLETDRCAQCNRVLDPSIKFAPHNIGFLPDFPEAHRPLFCSRSCIASMVKENAADIVKAEEHRFKNDFVGSSYRDVCDSFQRRFDANEEEYKRTKTWHEEEQTRAFALPTVELRSRFDAINQVLREAREKWKSDHWKIDAERDDALEKALKDDKRNCEKTIAYTYRRNVTTRKRYKYCQLSFRAGLSSCPAPI